jgi:isocitrate dehydrogenase
VPSLELVAEKTGNRTAAILAETLDQAIGKYLENSRFPSRKVNELDNRGCTFYLAMYWAQALAAQDKDAALKARFGKVAGELARNESEIAAQLLAAQGKPMDLGGYYLPDPERTAKAMRPSPIFNAIVDAA